MSESNAGYSRAVAWLRKSSWLEVIQAGYLILVCGMLLGFVFDEEIRKTIVKPLNLSLIAMLFVAKDLSSAPEAMTRWRAARTEGKGILAQVLAFAPPGLVGWMVLERQVWRAFGQWIRRRPNPVVRPQGVHLTFLRQGAYQAMVGFALVSLLIELPVSAAIVPLFDVDPSLVQKLHIFMTAGCAYSIVWLLGDRWHVMASFHVIDGDTLDLRIGERAQARIARSQIDRVERIGDTRRQWCARHKVELRDTIVISPIDRPNVVLTLAPGAQVPVSLFKVERLAPAHIFLYVDRPELLAHWHTS